MRRISLIATGLLAFAITICSAPAHAESETTPELVHRLVLEGWPDYYGSAILYHVAGREALFVTNSHLVPESMRSSAFEVEGLVTGGRSLGVKLIGQAPGRDLAVLRATLPQPLAASDEARLNEQWERFRAASAEWTPPRGPIEIDGGVIGIPSANAEARAWDDFDGEELRHNEHFSANAAVEIKGNISLETHTICPPLFLERCYRLDWLSHGFSGGLVYVGSEKDRMIGIVSHFSPLAGETYLIPFDEVVRTADRLIARAPKLDEPYVERHDAAGIFEYVGPGHVRILKGDLAGTVVSGVENVKPGGGDVSHGGGDVSHGGGDVSHGGGEAIGPQWLPGSVVPMKFALHDVAGWHPSHRNSIAGALRSFRWWQGMDAFLGYQPGVTIAGRDVHFLDFSGDEEGTDYLQRFLYVYRTRHIAGGEAFSLGEGFGHLEAPSGLTFVGNCQKTDSFLYRQVLDDRESWHVYNSWQVPTHMKFTLELDHGTIVKLTPTIPHLPTGYLLPGSIEKIGALTYRYHGHITTAPWHAIFETQGVGKIEGGIMARVLIQLEPTRNELSFKMLYLHGENPDRLVNINSFPETLRLRSIAGRFSLGDGVRVDGK